MGVQRRGCRSFQLVDDPIFPRCGDAGAALIHGQKVNSGTSMGHVVELGIRPTELRAIVDFLEIFFHFGPWRGANVFEDDNGWSMPFDPRHHATESPSRFAIGIYVLFLVVEIRIIDARSACD